MVMLSLPVILLGIIVIEQLVVIIMLIVMNCKIKKEKMPRLFKIRFHRRGHTQKGL